MPRASLSYCAHNALKVMSERACRQITVEAPKCGEVRVRVVANALCHTDVYTWEGSDPGVASSLKRALRKPYASLKRALREP